MEKSLFRRIIVGVLLFACTYVLTAPRMNIPHYWDAGVTIVPEIFAVQESGYNPFSTPFGHPPVFYEFCAIIFSTFGYSIWMSRFIVVVLSFLAAYLSYLLGALLFNERVGIIASILLVSSPLFLAQAGNVTLEPALMFLTVLSIYLYFKGKYRAYFVAGSLLTLTKEMGDVAICALAMYSVYKNWKKPRKQLGRELFLAISPMLSFCLWVIGNRLWRGWFFSPNNTAFISANIFDANHASHISRRVWEALFMQYNWVVLLVILVFLIYRAFGLGLNSDATRVWVALGVIIGASVIISYSMGRDAVQLLAFLAFNALYFIGVRREQDDRLMPLVLSITGYVFFYGGIILAFWLARYTLPVYPLFFIIGAHAIDELIKKNGLKAITTAGIVILFISSWGGNRDLLATGQVFEEADSNLEYADIVAVRKTAIDYISRDYPESTILTGWYSESYELTRPLMGYVKAPLKVRTDIYSIVDNPGPGYGLRCDEYDLVYYVSESNFSPYLLDKVKEACNLTLQRRYERNNKVAEVYLVRGFNVG